MVCGRRNSWSRPFAWLASLVLGLQVTSAWAAPSVKDRVEANKLVTAGIRFDKQGDNDQARKSFEQAIELHDTARTRMLLAKTLSKLGLVIEARDHAEAVADNARAPYRERQASKRLLEDLASRIAFITLHVADGLAPQVKIGDTLVEASGFGVPLEYNPGEVTVRAEADGYEVYTRQFKLKEGEKRTLRIKMLRLRSSHEDADADKLRSADEEVDSTGVSTGEVLGWVSVGVGAVGVAMGLGYGLAAKSVRDDLRSLCHNDVCAQRHRSLYDQGRRHASVSTASFAVGGVGLAAGIALMLTAPSSGSQESETVPAKGVSLNPYLSPQSAGVYGRF